MSPQGDFSSTAAHELLQNAFERLRAAGIDTPILDAEILLSRVLEITRTQLITHLETKPPCESVALFDKWVERRARREPLAYIIGQREFYGLCFEVNPSVLVPRPETEILVETSILLLKDIPNPRIVDIGVGSGAIAVSLAHALPKSRVCGTEISTEAIAVARKNAERIGVSERVQILDGDLFQPLRDMSFDLIVSNPPYIPSGDIDSLEPEVARCEPRGALDGGTDGLDYYRRICSESPEYLVAGGHLAVEVGQGQADDVKGLMRDGGFHEVRSVKDYSGIERVVIGRMGGE